MEGSLECEGLRGPSRSSASSHYIKDGAQKWRVLQEDHLDPLFAFHGVSLLNHAVACYVGAELLFVMRFF